MTSVSIEPRDRRKFDWAAALEALGPAIGLVLVCALFAILRPRTFLTIDNIQLMFMQTAVVGTAALGMTMIIISGGIDLSVGSNIALCTVAVASFLSYQWPGWVAQPVVPVLAVCGGIVASALWGSVIGLMVTQIEFRTYVAPAWNVLLSAGATYLLLEKDVSSVMWAILPGVGLMLVALAVGVVLPRLASRVKPALTASVTGAVCLAGVATAWLHTKQGTDLPRAIAGGVGIAAGVQLIWLTSWFVIAWVKLAPFIVTLGLWGAVRGAGKGWADEHTVRAPETILNRLMEYQNITTEYPKSEGLLEAARVLFQNLYHATVDRNILGLFTHGVWIMLVLAVIVWAMLRYTRFGRHIFAIGSNEQTARLCGVRVETSKLMIYTIAGALAGVAGVLQFSFLTLGDPTTAMGMELNIIAAVVIGGASLNGGQGSIFGTMMGALMMTAIASGCTKMEWKNWQQEIITGGIIILASALDQLRQRRGT